jgi:hypothetical protein
MLDMICQLSWLIVFLKNGWHLGLHGYQLFVAQKADGWAWWRLPPTMQTPGGIVIGSVSRSINPTLVRAWPMVSPGWTQTVMVVTGSTAGEQLLGI